MSKGLDNLKHIVVLMMGGRSFDHMLGGLKAQNPSIDGLTGYESNPDTTGELVRVQPLSDYQGQLVPKPDHHFPGVDLQIFGGQQGPNRQANMQGFIQSYYQQQKNVEQSHKILYYFRPEKLTVLTGLARQFAVFNGWFSSVPGPTICNRAFAHYGTSFGQTEADTFHTGASPHSIYERAILAERTARIYRYDNSSSATETASLLKNQPTIFGTFDQFLDDCKSGRLPDYSCVEPNYRNHEGHGGVVLASDQHPDHNVQQGERFMAMVYDAIFQNEALWNSTALLIVYDEHGGIYDHVVPPACKPDGYVASAADTGTGQPFAFDRLGVRVPAVLVSPWVRKGTVIPGPYQTNGRTFEHASIPATVMKWLLKDFDPNTLPAADRQKFLAATPREKAANTFLDLLTDERQPDDDCPYFSVNGGPAKPPGVPLVHGTATGYPGRLEADSQSGQAKQAGDTGSATSGGKTGDEAQSKRAREHGRIVSLVGPSTHVARDLWTTEDSLNYWPYAYAIYRFLTDPQTKPPLAISIQAPWGGGKTSPMRMVQAQLDPEAAGQIRAPKGPPVGSAGRATVRDILQDLEGTTPATPRKGSLTSKAAAPPVSRHRQLSVPEIEGPRERRVTVWFNAWKYESTAQVWAGLADSILQQVGASLNPAERELFWFRLQLRRLDAGKIRRRIHDEILSSFLRKLLPWSPAYLGTLILAALLAVMRSWAPAGGLLLPGIVGLYVQFRRTKAATEGRPAHLTLGEFVQAPNYASNLGFVHEVVKDLGHVFSLIPGKHLPMVIFIDDLDRCSPTKVASVVEAVNLFLAGELPGCMFVLGIDDEMVAAALEEAHSEVIARLPDHANPASIGRRFMDKFVQLPFVIPPAREKDIAHYLESLLSEGQGKSHVNMKARDMAAGMVEQGTQSPGAPDEVVKAVSSQHVIAPEQRAALKEETQVVQAMNEDIKRFTDSAPGIRETISRNAKRNFDNPRDTKKFVNLFRFYYFLCSARRAKGEEVPSEDQLCRWLVFCLRWPGFVRWLRRNPYPPIDSPETPFLSAFEAMAGESTDHTGWLTMVNKYYSLIPEQVPWLADKDLYLFLHREAKEFERTERLSSCLGMGLW